MSNKGRAVPWLDGAQYNRNRNQIPAQQLEPYAGQCVAFNLEGTEIVAHGSDRNAVETMLAKLGIDPGAVVFSRIPALDEDTWL